jgi:hypothetical protein
VLDIARESRGLITRFADHPLKEERKALLEYHDRVVRMGHDTAPLFAGEVLCVVNTEVNSHNFLVDGEDARLVDWEKAVRSLRYQDLGHFLVPTTTLWRSEYVYGEDEKLRFLERYRDLAGLRVPLEELREKTRILERTILLRGLSWCFMAYYEYTRGDRALSSAYTFRKIRKTTSRRYRGFWRAYERGAGDIGHHPRASRGVGDSTDASIPCATRPAAANGTRSSWWTAIGAGERARLSIGRI